MSEHWGYYTRNGRMASSRIGASNMKDKGYVMHYGEEGVLKGYWGDKVFEHSLNTKLEC